MGQRLVVWHPSYHLDHPRAGKVLVLDLSRESLSKEHPDLAEAMGGGRIVSHTYGSGVYTFVVED